MRGKTPSKLLGVDVQSLPNGKTSDVSRDTVFMACTKYRWKKINKLTANTNSVHVQTNFSLCPKKWEKLENENL